MNLRRLLLFIVVIGLISYGYLKLQSNNQPETPATSVGEELELITQEPVQPTSPFPGIDNLYEAVEARSIPAVRYFLDQGADINTQFTFDRVTPLMIAAREGDEKMLKLLLARGADVTLTDINGKTAADLAWAQRHKTGDVKLYTDITLMLEKAGATRTQ